MSEPTEVALTRDADRPGGSDPSPAAGARQPEPRRWRPATGHVATAAVAVLAAVMPAVLDESALSVYILLGLAATVTVGVSLLMGYAGQVPLGQAAFYATGGYTAALLSMHGVPSLVGLLAAPFVAAVFALIVGVPILRLRGHHLAFATLALQLIFLSLVGQFDYTGGDIGLQGVPRLRIGSAELSADREYAYAAWAALGLVLLVAYHVIHSRPGRALRALATSEVAAESSGVPVGRYRLFVFALSAAFAGLAGGVYAFYLGYVAPASFPVLLSFQYVVMAVVGGLGTLWGALIGATVITVLIQALNRIGTLEGMPSYAPSVLSYAVYSLLLVVVVLLSPQGLVPTVRDAWQAGVARFSGGGRASRR